MVGEKKRRRKKQEQVGLNPQMAAEIFFFCTEAIVPILKDMARALGTRAWNNFFFLTKIDFYFFSVFPFFLILFPPNFLFFRFSKMIFLKKNKIN